MNRAIVIEDSLYFCVDYSPWCIHAATKTTPQLVQKSPAGA